MKKFSLTFLLLMGTLLFSACVHQQFQCTDSLGCITVGNGESIKLGVLLTLSGQQSAAGIDALRGVQLAITDKGQVFGHSIELVQQDDQCSQSGGQSGAQALAGNKQIVGIIGASCSSSSQSAAVILSNAGYVMISPSSSLPVLTDPHAHQVGFLRTAYNDGNQAQEVAKFAFSVLGAKTLVTVSDTSDASDQLALATCQDFVALGGKCSIQIQLAPGQDATAAVQGLATARPDVVFLPGNSTVAIAIANGLASVSLSSVALIGPYNLMSKDFIGQMQSNFGSMYFSGAIPINDPQDFLQKYKSKFGESPISSDHLQAYDAATLLFAAIERVAVPTSSMDNSIAIPRKALRTTLYSLQSMEGLSGHLTCKLTGDCAQDTTVIYQFTSDNFKQIFP